MARRIKRVADLPEWFELRKYDEAHRLDTAGWYEQFKVRESLQGLLGGSHSLNFQKGVARTVGEHLLEVLKLVRDKPIVDTHSDVILMAYFMGGELHEVKSRSPLYSRGVHLATVRNLYLTEGNIEPDKRVYARAFFKGLFDRDWTKPLTHKCTDWIDEPVDGIVTNSSGFKVMLKANLSLPDNVLVEQFKQLLPDLRNSLRLAGITIPESPTVS